jgi:hypothetical protein
MKTIGVCMEKNALTTIVIETTNIESINMVLKPYLFIKNVLAGFIPMFPTNINSTILPE